MSGYLTQLGLGGGARVTSLAGDMSAWISALSVVGPAVATASGPMTSGAWKTVLSVTGSAGALKLLAARSTNTTTKTLELRITRDGSNVIFDKTSASTSAIGGIAAYGSVHGSTNYAVGDGADVLFDTSLLIEAKYVSGGTPSETDGFNFYVNYDLRG